MSMQKSFFLFALALFATGCASPGPQSGRQAIAAQARAERTYSFDPDVCFDQLGSPARPYPDDLRINIDPACRVLPVIVPQRRVLRRMRLSRR